MAKWYAVRIGVALGLGWLAGGALAAEMAEITAAAQRAETECNQLMHDNADEFMSCLDALADRVKGRDKRAQRERLGLAYFGWVGATRWGRVGMPGADEAALKYYLRFLPLQHQLQLTDEQMCPVLSGECKVRLAQLREIAAWAEVAKASAKAAAKASAKSSAKASAKASGKASANAAANAAANASSNAAANASGQAAVATGNASKPAKLEPDAKPGK